MAEINNDINQTSEQEDKSTSNVWLWILLGIIIIALFFFLLTHSSENAPEITSPNPEAADVIASAFGISG
jgi:prolipoprotein diacylglyceryltransferase